MLATFWTLQAIAATPFVVTSVPVGTDPSVVGALCSTESKLPTPSFVATCTDSRTHTFQGITVRTALTFDEKRRLSLFEAESFGVIGALSTSVEGAQPFGDGALPESPGIATLLGLAASAPAPDERLDQGPVQDDSGRVWWRFVGDKLVVTANFPGSGWFALGFGAPEPRAIVVLPNGFQPNAMECAALPPLPCGVGTPLVARKTSSGAFTTIEIDVPTTSPAGGARLVPGGRVTLSARWGAGAAPDGDLPTGSIYEDVTL